MRINLSSDSRSVMDVPTAQLLRPTSTRGKLMMGRFAESLLSHSLITNDFLLLDSFLAYFFDIWQLVSSFLQHGEPAERNKGRV